MCIIDLIECCVVAMLTRPLPALDAQNDASATFFFRTPASVDTSVSFEVPAVLPADDKKFFEEFLDK